MKHPIREFKQRWPRSYRLFADDLKNIEYVRKKLAKEYAPEATITETDAVRICFRAVARLIRQGDLTAKDLGQAG